MACLGSFRAGLAALMALSTALPAQAEDIIWLSGWRQAPTDAMGNEGEILATAPVPGLDGAHVTAAIACVDSGQPDGFEIRWLTRIAPLDLDAVGGGTRITNWGGYSTAQHYQPTIPVQGRFDNDPAVSFQGLVANAHQFGFFDDPTAYVGRHRLLIRFSAEGEPVTVNLDLKDGVVAAVVQSCVTAKADQDRAKAAEEAPARAAVAAQAAQQARQQATVQNYVRAHAQMIDYCNAGKKMRQRAGILQPNGSIVPVPPVAGILVGTGVDRQRPDMCHTQMMVDGQVRSSITLLDILEPAE